MGRSVAILVALALSASTVEARTLTLEEVEASALLHQPLLRQAHALTDAARARADQARAPILPQLGGVATYQRTTANFAPRPGLLPRTTTTSTTTPPTFDTFDYFSFGLTLTQALVDVPAIERWQASRIAAGAQQASEVAARQQALMTARVAFFAVRAQAELTEVARETLANQRRHAEQIEAFVRVGARPEIDVVQARTDAANAEVQLINTDNALQNAKAQLNQAMGLEGDLDYTVEGGDLPPIAGEDRPTDELLAEAALARPDLRALAEQVRAQRTSVTAAKAAFGPTLGASMALTDQGTDVSALAWNWSVSVTASWSLFSGLVTLSQLREAQANQRAAEAQRDQLWQQIRTEVEQARLGVRAAKAALHASETALGNARERLRLAEGRYATGSGNVIELGDAQLALTSAAAQRTQSAFTLSVARAQLLRALGRT